MIYDFLQDLEAAPGVNCKTKLLQSMPEYMDKVFHYALNPFWNYNVVNINPVAHGDERIDERTFELLDKCRLGELTGGAAKHALTQHAESLMTTDQHVLRMILEGKLRVGLGIKSLNKFLRNKIPVHDTMLASKFDKAKIRFPIWASPKLDGMRCQYVNTDRFVSRTGKKIVGVGHLLEPLADFPDLDGELMVPGDHFQVSLGKLRSHANVPNAVFYVFDTIDENAKFEDRLEIIRELKDVHPNVKVVKHVLVHNVDELMDMYAMCISKGLEGLVIKTVGHKYQRTRSKDWMKMKEVGSVDVRVCGFQEGEGKYVGTLGALLVKLDNGQVTHVGTGFSDALRHDIWSNRDSMIDRHVEIQYHEITKDGNLRHPRFYRWREDKDS